MGAGAGLAGGGAGGGFWGGFVAGRGRGASRAPALSGSDVSPTSGLARRLAAYATPTATTRPTTASAIHPATVRLPVVMSSPPEGTRSGHMLHRRFDWQWS